MNSGPDTQDGWRIRLIRWRDALRDYFGSASRQRSQPIRTRDDLRTFLQTRSSFVAQTSLYGYLRTRAGMRYPQLFDDDGFARSINAAKWHLWLDCLSDLSVYAGGRIAARESGHTRNTGDLLRTLVDEVLAASGTPADADATYADHANRVRARLAACNWDEIGDDETAFSTSPAALVRWAPVIENLKELDEEIIRNSVRFRWQEIRRELRQQLEVTALLHADEPARS